MFSGLLGVGFDCYLGLDFRMRVAVFLWFVCFGCGLC